MGDGREVVSEIVRGVRRHLNASGLIISEVRQQRAKVSDAIMNEPEAAACVGTVSALLRSWSLLQHHNRRALFPRSQRAAQSCVSCAYNDDVEVWLLGVCQLNSLRLKIWIQYIGRRASALVGASHDVLLTPQHANPTILALAETLNNPLFGGHRHGPTNSPH